MALNTGGLAHAKRRFGLLVLCMMIGIQAVNLAQMPTPVSYYCGGGG
jgi:hypothetical protein